MRKMKWFKIEDLDIYISDGNYSSKYPRSSEFVSSGIPFIRANNLLNKTISPQEMYFITPEKHQTLLKGHIKTGDILITTRGDLGKTALVPESYNDANINAQLVLLRANPQQIDPKFLIWCFDTVEVKFQITQLQTGTALQQLPVGKLRKIEIPVPSLEEQKRIAEILDRAEELRSKRREAIAQLDTLTQAIFLEMFGDPVTNAMGWEIKPFGKLVINKDSKRKPVKEEDRTKQEKIYPYYGAIGIIDYVDNFLFDGTNLLIEEDGMNLVTRNKPIALIAQGKYWVNNHAHVVCEKEKINLNYLCHYLNYQDISNFVTGIDQKKLNRTNLDKIPVYLPPLPLQQEFARRVEAVEKLKAAHRASLSELDALFASLQHRAFRGEL